MKKIQTTFFGLCIAVLAFGQDSEPAIAKVHYIFTHVNDTTQPDKHLRDEVVTYLGEFSSFYSSYSDVRAREATQKQLEDPAFDGKLVVTRNTSSIKDNYLINDSDQSMVTITRVATDQFLLEDSYPEQDWSITEDTKTIGGYEVQKAECTFKGRNYTAWFSPELPFPAGPWKLRGLPGLILEAYDSKQEVKFEYSGFDIIKENPFTIEVPEKALKSKPQEVAKLEEAFKANPNAYMQSKGASRMQGSGNSNMIIRGSGNTNARTSSSSNTGKMDISKIKSITVSNSDDYKPSKTTNNPIELTP